MSDTAAWKISEADTVRIQSLKRGSRPHRYMCLRVFARSHVAVVAESSELEMHDLWAAMPESERDEVRYALGTISNPMAN